MVIASTFFRRHQTRRTGQITRGGLDRQFRSTSKAVPTRGITCSLPLLPSNPAVGGLCPVVSVATRGNWPPGRSCLRLAPKEVITAHYEHKHGSRARQRSTIKTIFPPPLPPAFTPSYLPRSQPNPVTCATSYLPLSQNSRA